MRHYVGVSGVANPVQQEVACQLARDNGLNNGFYDLMLGVKATEKTQWHNEPNKYGTDWYPVGDAFSGAIEQIIDYKDLDRTSSMRFMQPAVQMFFGSLANDPELARRFTEGVIDRSSGWKRCVNDGMTAVGVTLQFDRFPWMEQSLNEYFKWLLNCSDVHEVILQCYGDYMASFHPYEIVRRLSQVLELGRKPLRILFDASHGTGKDMDPETLRPFIGGLVESNLCGVVEVVVAGGLCGDNLEKFIPPLIEEFDLLSWDAEGKLHYKDKVNNGDFIPEQLRRYIQMSAEIVRLYDIDLPEYDESDS